MADNDKDKEQKKKSALAKAGAANANRQRLSLREYFKGVRIEMKKVVWPTRQELIAYTWTVLLTCFAFGVFFWITDSVFMWLLKLALSFSGSV